MKKDKKTIVILGVIIIVLVSLILTGITIYYTTGPRYSSKDDDSDDKVIQSSTIKFSYQKEELMFGNMNSNEIKEPSKYIEFGFEGKNSTDRVIDCRVKITRGKNHATKNIRIQDNHLMFKLVEVNGDKEIELFSDKVYESLDNRTILMETINQNETIDKTYKLYMYVSNDIKLGNTANSDYTSLDWENDVYASVKIMYACDYLEINK